MGTVHEDQNTFFIIYRSFLLELEMLQTKVVEKIKTHVLYSNISFFENPAVYEKMWKNMTIWPMHIVSLITKATDTHTLVV